jgi:hypothetical protein
MIRLHFSPSIVSQSEYYLPLCLLVGWGMLLTNELEVNFPRLAARELGVQISASNHISAIKGGHSFRIQKIKYMEKYSRTSYDI